ncbi:MAG: hypothetical protein U5K31_10445 [Balneolaceae bacterium]|nr:hypothetical protein [Balneolaceae bacterium]
MPREFSAASNAMATPDNAPIDVWSGKRDPSARPVTLKTLDRFGFRVKKSFHVAPQNEERLRAFNDRLLRRGRTALWTVLAISALMVILVLAALLLSWSADIILLVVGLLTSCTGIAVYYFPFATPETIRWIGLRGPIRLSRISGLVTVLLGLVVALIL